MLDFAEFAEELRREMALPAVAVLRPESRLVEDLRLDSVQLVELGLVVEDHLAVGAVSTRPVSKARTLGEVFDIVVKFGANDE